MGVRVFPEGVDRDTKGLEKSKNATRREARGARRTHQRKNQRKERLLNNLQEIGFLPADDSKLRSLFQANPYQLRKKGLDEKLEKYEFGRVLYHINQRRGFKSNRKSGKQKEDGIVKKEASALQKQINDAGCRSIGEYFAGFNPEEQRIRRKYTFRSMYENEFDLLWKKQNEFYSDLTEELKKKIRDEIIFYQRPLKPMDELIGECELETGEKRCQRGDWYARRFRLLQDINNLKIQNPDGSENNLSDEQRKTLLGELGYEEKLSFDEIRNKFGLIETQKFNAEYKTGPKGKTVKSTQGDTFVAKMASKKVFGLKVWDGMTEQQKIDLNTEFIELEDDALAEKLKSQYGLNDKQIEAAMKISLPQGYMSYSRKAIRKLLPFMESGSLTNEAKEKAGYKNIGKNAEKSLDRLPLPPDLRNPIVQKGLYEVRKVINAIIREYGKPSKIKLEMARDVQGNKKQREELHWKILENEKRNKDVRERLMQDLNIINPSRDDAIKYKLWEECGKICPYTGKSISQQALFGQHPEFQIEHILPYERSLDDSFMNKTLCEVYENIHIKKGQTPYEAYSSNLEKYEQILERVNKSQMPYAKRKKFWQAEIDLDQQITRELNDTRYICREVVKYLKQLGVYVQGTRGKITNELRYQWGLDGIFSELDSLRDEDHRRHAVDAAIVAVTENEHLRKLARSKYAVNGNSFEQPWPDFRTELKEKVNNINVSHRARRKVSGKLHEDTNYGRTEKEGVLVFRKKLEDLTLPMVEKIVDPVVKEIVKNRLIENGVNLQGGGTPPKEVWNKPLYMKTIKSQKKVRIKKVRLFNIAKNVIPIQDFTGKPYKYVEPGSNHHIEIFESIDKKGRIKREGRVISMFEAQQRNRKGEPVIKKDYEDSKKFVCSLCKGDMFLLQKTEKEQFLCCVQEIWESTNIVLRSHIHSVEKEEINKSASKLFGHKVTIDPLGRIQPAND